MRAHKHVCGAHLLELLAGPVCDERRHEGEIEAKLQPKEKEQ